MAGYVQDAILLLGDSITQGATIPHGYAQQLASTLCYASSIATISLSHNLI